MTRDEAKEELKKLNALDVMICDYPLKAGPLADFMLKCFQAFGHDETQVILRELAQEKKMHALSSKEQH